MDGEEVQPTAPPAEAPATPVEVVPIPVETHAPEIAPPPTPEATEDKQPTPVVTRTVSQAENPSLDAQREKAKQKIASKKRAKLEKIIELAKSNPKITNDDVEKLLHVSDSTATRYLKILVKEGKLRAIGHPKDLKYELSS